MDPQWAGTRSYRGAIITDIEGFRKTAGIVLVRGPLMAQSGLFQRARLTSAFGGGAAIPHQMGRPYKDDERAGCALWRKFVRTHDC
jgi:hypothetical protein